MGWAMRASRELMLWILWRGFRSSQK
jgi:hypothetical protein